MSMAIRLIQSGRVAGRKDAGRKISSSTALNMERGDGVCVYVCVCDLRGSGHGQGRGE